MPPVVVEMKNERHARAYARFLELHEDLQDTLIALVDGAWVSRLRRPRVPPSSASSGQSQPMGHGLDCP
jgi:hypothetical protein